MKLRRMYYEKGSQYIVLFTGLQPLFADLTSLSPSIFHDTPKTTYEKLFYREMEKSLPQEENCVSLIVPITTDIISDGTFTRYFTYAYWGQFTLDGNWLKEGQSILAPYELLILQEDNECQTVMTTIHWPETEIAEKNSMPAYSDAEQLLKEKLKTSLPKEKQLSALEFLANNAEAPRTFLHKIYPRNQEKIRNEIQPKIQTVIEKYLKAQNLTIEGYTCLSERRFKQK